MGVFKKSKISIAALVFTAISLVSCATDLTETDIEVEETTYKNQAGSGYDKELDDIVPNTQIKTFTVSEAVQLFEVEAGVGSVTLNNVDDKEIFVVSQNNTTKKIETKSALTIASMAASGRAAIKEQNNIGDSEAEIEDYNGFSSVNIKSVSPNLSKSTSSNRAATGTYDKGTTPRVGSQKALFVDSNEALTQFKKRMGKLEVEGKYCNIWSIVDDSILDNVSARNLASTFDAYYQEMISIFGKESNKVYIYNDSKFTLDDMKNHTNTGDKVNIVVYTITKPTVVGYFHSKDYYETADELKATTGLSYATNDAANYSNCGKFFYINYRYASGEKDNWSNPELNKKLAISTLIHEFQHMINFSVKNMNGLQPSSWYNEMLSMLAEDMFATRLGTGEKAPSVMRMNTFMDNYYKSGLKEFSNSYAYGTSYAFGAWLVRNFGGTDFIRLLMSNKKVDEDSIVSAVNLVSQTQYDFNKLFNEYVKDCVNSDNFGSLTDLTENGNKYVFNEIKNNPIVNPVGKNVGTDIGPYGFVVRKVEVTNGTATFSLSERTKREKVFLIIK